MFSTHFCAYNWAVLDCCRWCNFCIYLRKIDFCLHPLLPWAVFPRATRSWEDHSNAMTSFWEKPLLLKVLFLAFSFTNRSVMWQSMEALVPGLDGPLVVTMMEVAQGPVSVGHEPVIIPLRSVEANSVMGSALKLPTAPGEFLWWFLSSNLRSVLLLLIFTV